MNVSRVLAHVRRIEDELAALRLELVANGFDAPAPAVMSALAQAFGTEGFTSSEAWALAVSQAEGADALGQAPPGLPHALGVAGIRGPHALGRLLASLQGRGIERVGTIRDGTLWATAVSCGDQTARRLRAAPRAG